MAMPASVRFPSAFPQPVRGAKPAEYTRVLQSLGRDGRTTCSAAEIFAVLQALQAQPVPLPYPRPGLRIKIRSALDPMLLLPPPAPRRTGSAPSFEQVKVINPHTGREETVFVDKGARQALNALVPCKSWGWLSASLCPVRTGKVRHLATDLFLPTTLNQAARIKNVAVRIFAVLGALLFDLITLAFRVLSVVPRVIYNALQPYNNMRALLLDKGISADLLDEGIIDMQQPDHPKSNRLYNLIAFPEIRGLAR